MVGARLMDCSKETALYRNNGIIYHRLYLKKCYISEVESLHVVHYRSLWLTTRSAAVVETGL